MHTQMVCSRSLPVFPAAIELCVYCQEPDIEFFVRVGEEVVGIVCDECDEVPF